MSEDPGKAPVVLVRDLDRATAEVLRGLLEAQEIPAVLSQESAASAIPVTVGLFGLVDVLVPAALEADARRVLEEFRAGPADPNPTDSD